MTRVCPNILDLVSQIRLKNKIITIEQNVLEKYVLASLS